MTFAPPPSPMQSGPTIFNVNVSNTAKLSRELTLVYAGSFVRAYWSGQADSAVASFQAGETKQIEIEFNPAAGYEDLNAIYLLESGRLQSELILDYSIVSDPLIHTIEIDSGGVESGNAKDWGTYDISVSKPPLFHSVRKECVWTTGDRTQCVQNNYATCKLNPTSEDEASATFALQGHSESPGARNLSVGHLRVAYQLTGPPVALK